MKIIVPILLLSVMLAACIGQRATTAHRSATFDCEILVKKHRQQFRKAMLQAKASQRRKPSDAKRKYQQATMAAATAKRPNELAPDAENAFKEYAAYSTSLVLNSTVAADQKIIPRNTLRLDQTVADPYVFSPSDEFPTSNAVFENFTNDIWIWPAILFSGAIGMLMMTVFQNQAKLMSRWAKENKWKARSTLVVAKLGTGVGCVFLGNELYNSSVAVPDFVKISTLGVLALAITFYPSKYFPSGAPAFGFLERKFYDGSIFVAGAIVMLYAGNHYDVTLQRAYPVQTVAYVGLPAEGTGGVNKKISLVKKEFKQKLKTFLQNPPKERTSGEKTALTILAVLAAVVLTFGVASLSCSLSCSGSEAASVFVFVGGMGLIIWGLVATIRAIHSRPTKKRATSLESAT